MNPFPVAVMSTVNFLAKPGMATFLTTSGDAHAVGGNVSIVPVAVLRPVNESSTGDCHCCVRPAAPTALGERVCSDEFQPLRERLPVMVTMSPSCGESAAARDVCTSGAEEGEERQAAVEAPSASARP